MNVHSSSLAVEALADPVLDARDVIESFRAAGVLLDGWRELLAAAADRFDAAGAVTLAGVSLSELARLLRHLAQHGMTARRPDSAPAVAAAAGALDQLVDAVRAPGIPAPTDDDWTFRTR